ncbi:MAG: exosome complex exonuclease Rrp41 [Candidatus Altiarchaeales archaeon]|nr:MAG: exosome complex exonuclease Rrp41 [Candidatus Altiarchaeales archaeon]
MSSNEEMVLIKDGKRLDGRDFDELRDVKMEVSVLERAVGSAYMEWGKNKVMAAVYGPRELHPKFLQDPTKALLRCTYNLAPFSVEERKRPGPDRRSVEISKVTTEALSSVVMLEKFPNTVIDVFIEILQADAGTRCVGLTAASLALADAGIPMRDLVAACSAGKIQGEIVVDLMKEEDNYGECDLPLAIIPRKGEVVLLQMDGKLTKDEFKKAYELAFKGAMKVYEMQKNTLLGSMKRFVGEGGNDDGN